MSKNKHATAAKHEPSEAEIKAKATKILHTLMGADIPAEEWIDILAEIEARLKKTAGAK